MEKAAKFDAWNAGDAYEHYMGRWSGPIAEEFIAWLGVPKNAHWLDIGCGTGQVTKAVLAACEPQSVTGIDASEGFVGFARQSIGDAHAGFFVGDALALPAPDSAMDVTVSGLVLNFVADKVAALGEMRRVLKPGGLLSFYVWDYPGGGMGLIDVFWKAAARLDPAAAELDESNRFPDCTAKGLQALCQAASLPDAEVRAIDRRSDFASFADFWEPFTLGAGPAPGYVKGLGAEQQDALRSQLRADLGGDGPVSLPARAWAVKVRLPG